MTRQFYRKSVQQRSPYVGDTVSPPLSRLVPLLPTTHKLKVLQSGSWSKVGARGAKKKEQPQSIFGINRFSLRRWQGTGSKEPGEDWKAAGLERIVNSGLQGERGPVYWGITASLSLALLRCHKEGIFHLFIQFHAASTLQRLSSLSQAAWSFWLPQVLATKKQKKHFTETLLWACCCFSSCAIRVREPSDMSTNKLLNLWMCGFCRGLLSGGVGMAAVLSAAWTTFAFVSLLIHTYPDLSHI